METGLLFTLALLILLALVFPVLGVRDHRLLLQRISEGDSQARSKFYKDVLIWHWPLTIGFLGWWLLSGNSLDSVGLLPVVAEGQWLSIGIGLAVVATQIIYLAQVTRSEEKLAAAREQIGDLSSLAPRTDSEARLFDMVSITAGICEEILYRGLLLAVLVPLTGLWPAVVLSSLIFGLGHAYQGIAGILKTGLVGLALALLTVFTGSLFIAILLHTVLDMSSGRVMRKAMQLTPQAA